MNAPLSTAKTLLKNPPRRIDFKAWVVFVISLGVLGGAVPLRGSDYSLTVPFPIRSADWQDSNGLFSAPPQQILSPDGLGLAEFHLTPVEESTEVFLSFVFENKTDTPLSVRWKSTETGFEIPLSENLSEGVSGWSQRTIRLPSSLAKQGGLILVDGNQRSIARIRMDWLKPTETYVAVDQAIPGLVLGGRLIEDAALTGRPEMSPPDAWFGEVFETALQDDPVSMDGGILFEIPFAESHATILLKAMFQGVAPGDAVEVWINDKRAGSIQPETPPLTDPGYVRTVDQRVVYAGWRKGSIFIPGEMFQAGENTLVLRPATPGCSMRDAALQILVPFDPGSPDPINLAWPEE